MEYKNLWLTNNPWKLKSMFKIITVANLTNYGTKNNSPLQLKWMIKHITFEHLIINQC